MPKLEPLGVSHWKLSLGGEEAVGFFRSVSAMGASVEHSDFPYNSEPGNPVKAWVPTGGHISYQEPITLERGLDAELKLWEWVKKVMGEFDPDSAMRELTIELLNYKNETKAKFKATGVWPASYATSNWNAMGAKGDPAIETLGLAVETWERF
jgi:phage tail-like protein